MSDLEFLPSDEEDGPVNIHDNLVLVPTSKEQSKDQNQNQNQEQLADNKINSNVNVDQDTVTVTVDTDDDDDDSSDDEFGNDFEFGGLLVSLSFILLLTLTC